MLNQFHISRKEIWMILVTLLFVTFPWSERINSLFLVLLSVFWLMDKNLFQKLSSLKTTQSQWLPFFTFFMIHFFFLFQMTRYEEAIQTILVKFTLFWFPILFSSENYLNERFKRNLFFLFSISLFMSVCYCVYEYYMTYYDVVQWQMIFKRMYFSRIMHPGYYSNFFVVAIFYFSIDLFESKKINTIEKKVEIFFLIFFLLISFILASKTAIIVLFLFFCFLLWKKISIHFKSVTKYVIAVATFAALVAAFLFIPFVKNRVSETINDFQTINKNVDFDNSTGSRMVAWSVEWKLIQQKWIFGYGVGNANQVLLNEFKKGNYMDLAENEMHTHNQYFHTWLDLGILGVLSLVSLFIFLMIFFYRKKEFVGLWTSILLAIYCLTDDALEIQVIVVFCMLVITLFLFQKNTQSEKN